MALLMALILHFTAVEHACNQLRIVVNINGFKAMQSDITPLTFQSSATSKEYLQIWIIAMPLYCILGYVCVKISS